MVSIATLAEREARAEASKSKADTAWRAAWWDTTLALGAIPQTHKKELGEAQAIVCEATGNKADHVKVRTRTGRTFGGIDPTEIPPTMAVEVVKQGIPVTVALALAMVKAERDGMTVRDFIAAQPGGRYWSDTPEGASEATIQAIVQAQPERVGRVVARHPQAQRAVLREGLSTHGIDMDRPIEPFPGDLMAEATRIVGRLHGIAHDVTELYGRAERDQIPALAERMEPGITKLLNAHVHLDEEVPR